ncbi:putative polysaccharide biosynthesis protein [Gorillibacterium sp. sgz500922]|uniref:putative polysaccharide biosynthesis protein n=1 Tax=Gorillibacterium sp. sgz500922 TaxID=3446694 RepID=UPI003F67EA38
MSKKDSLVKGTLILTLAAFVARFLGFVQRIPLQNLLGDSGMGTYTISYNVYFIFFTIATAGFPSAVSKLVSERMELGRKAEAERVFQAAIWFAVISGCLMTVLLYFFAPVQASWSKDPSAVGPIRAIAPALLLFPLAAIIRGYFQGRQHMMPNGLSQIFEQILRVSTAVFFAYWFIHVVDWGLNWGVTGASFGGVAGTIGAIAVLLLYLVRLRRKDEEEGMVPTERELLAASRIRYTSIYKALLIISVPIVVYSAAVPMVNIIDSTIVKPLLISSLGDQRAQDILGQLGGRAQSLAGLPIVLAIAISQSIVPIISAAFAKGDNRLVAKQAGRALQLAVLSGLPFVILITVGAAPINSLAFGNANGTNLIAFLTVTAMFQILMQTSGGILTGMGVMKPLVGHVVIGLAVKLAVSYLLSPFIGIYGIMGGTALCFIVMAWLNHRSLQQRVEGFRIFTRGRWTRLYFATAVVALAGWLVAWLSGKLISGLPYRIDFFLQSALVGIVVIGLYPVMLGVAKVVTREDLATYPASVQRLVAKAGRLIGFKA